jgi:hypothetical protein
MTAQPEQPSQEPWRAMHELPVQPYTPANVQAIADALSIPRVQLSTLHVSLPGATVVRGESMQMCPIAITFPIEDALQKTAQHYCEHPWY